MFVTLYIMCVGFFFLPAFGIFLVITGRQQFDYDVPWCGFFYIYFPWKFIELLGSVDL